MALTTEKRGYCILKAALGAILLICLALPAQVQAQVLYGSIAGRVTDATGAVMPGVEITIIDRSTNYTQTVISGETGTYTFRNVPRGTYRLSASLPGFREHVNDNVVVTVGSVTREEVVLQIGDIAEQITVSGAATLLQTDTTDVRTQLESKEITHLPLNQYRNYQSLINLVPGATPAGFQNAITDTPQRALTTNINGTARNNNNTRIDGAQSVNIWLPHHTQYVPPSETIEVVNVSTNNFDAETGFAGGAAITVVTKSGTNQVAGSLFYYHENARTNARNFFNFLDTDGDGKANKPAGRRHIGGLTVGGPIVQDKLFFFGGWEGTFQGLARTQTATVATQAMRNGDFSEFAEPIFDPLTGNPDGSDRMPFNNNQIPSGRLSPAAVAMAGLVPLPNLPGLTSNFEASDQEVMERNHFDVKLDWQRSQLHRIWGKFSLMDAEVTKNPIFGPGGGGAIGGGGDGVGDTDVKVYTIGHTWSFSPSFLWDGNFSYTDMDQEVRTADLDRGNFGLDVLGIPGTNAPDAQARACIVGGENLCGGVPAFFIDGFSGLGQVDGWSPLFRDQNSYTLANNFSLTTGHHEIRFGYDLIRHELDHWQPELGSGPRGVLRFDRFTTSTVGAPSPTDRNSWAAFMLGMTNSMGKSLQWELMTTREWQQAWYLRDRWQATPNLTITAGVRYEYYPLVTRDDRSMEFMDLDTFEVVLDNNISVSRKLLAPRLGFAYRLTDNDVIRSGYGITFNPMPFGRPLRGFFPLTVSQEFESGTFQSAGTLEEGIPIFVGPDTSPGARVQLPPTALMRTMPQDRINRGYIQSWNMVYERKLPSDFVVSLGYVGTQTTRQLADHNINWSPPGGGTAGRQFFPLSEVDVLFWDGWLSSNYHSLQVAINRRFRDGFFVKGAYTYGRAINMTDDDGWAGVSWNDPDLIHRNRAQAGHNRPHVLQLSSIYELPIGVGDTALDRIIGGWSLNSIFSVSQNTPFTVTSSSPINNRGNLQTADQVGSVNKLGGIGVGNPYYERAAFAPVTRVPGTDCTNFDCYGNSGRNILRGPTWVNLDLSVFRDFHVTEDVGLQFRTEFLNATNTPHFNNPTNNVSSGNFMFITSTSANAPERIIRFGLKLTF